jgi:hypothetical protein
MRTSTDEIGLECVCDDHRWSCTSDNVCPIEQPEAGAGCDDRHKGSECTYFIRESACMENLDISAHCSCEEGSWSCSEDLEDCFPDAGGEQG